MRVNGHKRKGQTITPDFLVSLLIFLAIVSTGLTLWKLAYENGSVNYDTEGMITKAM